MQSTILRVDVLNLKRTGLTNIVLKLELKKAELVMDLEEGTHCLPKLFHLLI